MSRSGGTGAVGVVILSLSILWSSVFISSDEGMEASNSLVILT